MVHYELYKKVLGLPGAIVECGVFKGSSFCRFAMFRELLENNYSRKIVGFDVFDKFPETNFESDKEIRGRFIQEAGNESITKEQLREVLENKNLNTSIELVKGNIMETVPKYVEQHPEFKIALLNLDTDIYEPAVVILEHLYPRIVNGGILIMDDYGVFPGETKAVDEYFKNKNVIIQKSSLNRTPTFIIKNEM